MSGKVNITILKKKKGFTLIELLVAVTASVMIVSMALGFYRDTSESFQTIEKKTADYNRNIRLTRLIKKILDHNSSHILMGNTEKITLISSANITGYGDEIIKIAALQAKDDSFKTRIKIIPLLFAPSSPDQELISQVYNNQDNLEKFSIQEIVSGVKPLFDYEHSTDNNERFPELHSGDYVKVILKSRKSENLFIAASK